MLENESCPDGSEEASAGLEELKSVIAAQRIIPPYK